MLKHIHRSELLETHPFSDKVTRLFLTLKFQFQFFLYVLNFGAEGPGGQMNWHF